MPVLRLLAFLIFALFPFEQYLWADWTRVNSAYGPYGSIPVSVSSYTVAQSIDTGASPGSVLAFPGGELTAGYLSQFYSRRIFPAIVGFDSDKGRIVSGVMWGTGEYSTHKVTFSNEMSTAALPQGVTVRQVADHLGNPLNVILDAKISYSPLERAVRISTGTLPWQKGGLFTISFSTAFSDLNGAGVESGATVYFSVTPDKTQENVLKPVGDAAVVLRVPAAAYAGDFFITLSTAQDSPEIISANHKNKHVGEPLKVLTAASYAPDGTAVQPGALCAINFTYRDVDNDGMVDGAIPPMKVRNLAVWLLDETSREWVRQSSSVLDRAGRTVSLNVGHFSSYALMGAPDEEVSSVYAYPVPFRPNAGTVARNGSWADLITFANLPSSGKIKIFTIDGRLIRELDIDSVRMKWDVKNSAGEVAASGVYLWEVTCGSNRKTGKLVVIK